MTTFLYVLISIITLEHIYFMILEMFFWTKPLGLKTFRQSAETAQITTRLAANQGLYNGFLAAGLIWSLVSTDLQMARSLKFFFLSYVALAGIFGAVTVNKRIFIIQALPALIALILLMRPYFDQ